MAEDILHGKSPAELAREIDCLVKRDNRSLPERSKTFAAIAKLQQFDVLPEVATFEGANDLIKNGGIELMRGLAAMKGVPAALYAKELILGPLYPGTQIAFGNGIYFAEPSGILEEGFGRVSAVAKKYVKSDGGESGILVRAVLRKEAKTIDCQEVLADWKSYKNRALAAGIKDIGAFAASIGIDALYQDGVYDDSEERVWVVLNRGAITVQSMVCLIRI